MGKRTIVLVVALLLAAVSAFSVWRYLTTVEDNIKQDIVEVEVFRATQDIETGTPGELARDFITPRGEATALRSAVVFEGSKILCTGPVEREGNDESLLGCPDNPADLDRLLDGTVAAGPISKGQLITEDLFVTPAELNSISLSESIAQGKVAIAIRPEETTAVGGFIRPGDKVNLIASTDIAVNSLIELLKDPELRELLIGAGIGTEPGQTGQDTGEETVDPVAAFAETLPGSIQFTQTVLQELDVIAVGPDTEAAPLGTGLEPQGTQVVVLEVTPEQAEKIEFARNYTNIALTLLPADVPYTPFEARGVVVDDLFTLLDRIVEQVEGTFGSQ